MWVLTLLVCQVFYWYRSNSAHCAEALVPNNINIQQNMKQAVGIIEALKNRRVFITGITTSELRHERKNVLHMRKQRRRSASR